MSQNSPKLQQESFFIDPLKFGKNKKIIRQDRWLLEPGVGFLKNDSYQFEMINMSPFGIAVLMDQNDFEKLKIKINESQLESYSIIYRNVSTQSISLRVVRIEPIPAGAETKVIVGLEIVGESIRVERCKALDAAHEVIVKQQTALSKNNQIPAEFRALVLEMKEWFSSLKNQIDEVEKKAPIDNAKENEDYKLTVSETISDFIGEIMPMVYANVKTITSKTDSSTIKLCTDYMREHVGEFVYKAPFAARAYYKPRGYAGDYEMMNHLYRNEMVGETLFDQCMHKYFIDEPAGNAVKNRGEYLFTKIKELISTKKPGDSIKILSIASGPAMEMQLFVKRCPEFHQYDIQFYCIDQDEESLKHAQRELLSINRFYNTNFKFNFSNLAIKNIIAQGVPASGFDLVYSAGLFDYFTDPVATMAGQKMFDAIKPGGKIIIGNFSKDNPNITQMEMVLDWILIYRDENDLKRIFSPISENLSVESEKLGINLFIVLKK